MLDLTKLTPTQRCVVNLLSHGYGTRGAAAFLGMSPKTAQVHIDSALMRTRAQTRAQLVAEYVRQTEIFSDGPSRT